MVGSEGEGEASPSKLDSKNLALVCGEPMTSIKESAADSVDVEVENKEISTGGNSVVEEKRDAIASVPVVDNGSAEAQAAVEMNVEQKETVNDIDIKKAEDVPCKQTVEMNVGVDSANNVDVGETEETRNEEVPEAGKETNSSEVAALGDMNINEGITASEHEREEKLLNNLQNEAANKVSADKSVGTPTDNGMTEDIDEDASIANDVASDSEKIDRSKGKILKKRGLKKQVLARNGLALMDEAELQCSTGDEASGEKDEANIKDCINNEEEVVPLDTGEQMKNLEMDAQVNMNINEVDFASEHEMTEKKLATDMHKGDNELNATEPTSTATGSEETEYMGEELRVVNDVNLATEKVVGPKRKVLKKKVVKKKMIVNAEAKSLPPSGGDTSIEANKGETIKDLKDEEKAVPADNGDIEATGGQLEAKLAAGVNKKRKRIRKKAWKVHANIAATGNEQKPKVINNEIGDTEDKEAEAQGVKNEDAAKPGEKGSGSTRRMKKKKEKEDTQKVVADGVNNPESSKKIKSLKRTESMGMIFMCSSETKKDCYRYKILGLPASKKDIVSKIYKGMRLFLFDYDLRMMYGIYKAAGPGGYNIEPKAFKSQFPSQVRFTVLQDCLPVAEENFKHAIKDNYYAKNKFSFQLTDQQVKNLCKLFTETTKRAESITARTEISAAPSFSKRARKRRRAENARKSELIKARKVERISSIELERSRRREQEELESRRRRDQEELERSRRSAHEAVRHSHPVLIYERHHHHPRVYDREPYPPPALPRTEYKPLPVHDHPPRTSYSYDYGEPSRVDIYRRELALDHRFLDLVPSPQDWEPLIPPPRNVDPYVPYSESHVYREPVYETSIRHEAAYETTTARPAEYYRTADYRAPLPPYRRY